MIEKYFKREHICKHFNTLIVICVIAITCVIFNPHIFGEKEQKQQETDLNFAGKLIENSSTGIFDFFDIAEEIIKEIIDKPSSTEIKQKAQIQSGKLKKAQAQTTRDPEKRIALNDEAIKILGDFIAENQGYSGLVDAKFEVAEILQTKALFIIAILKIETDSLKKQSFTEQADSIFKQSSEYLAEMISYCQKTLDTVSDSQKREEIENEFVRASFAHGLNFYRWQGLYGKGDENRKKYLGESIKILGNFILRFGEMGQSYEAADYVGLCYYELEDYSKAKAYFRMAADLYNIIMSEEEKTKQEKEEILQDSKDIIQKGFTHLAMLSNATKEYTQAIQIIDDLVKKFPKNQSDEWMERGLLEKARALFYKNDKDTAISIIQEIIGKTQNGAVRSSSKDTLNEFINKPGGAISPELSLNIMRDLFLKGKMFETIQQGQSLMSRLNKSPEEVKTQYLPEVLLIMGDAFKYQSPSRFYEAIILYEAIYLNLKYKDAQDTKKQPVAPVAAYRAAASYLEIGSQTGDESDRAKYKETLLYLVKNWPDSDPAKEVQYYQAKEYELQGKYLEASDCYSKVSPSSKNYYESRFRAGYMYYLTIDKNFYLSYRKESDDTKKKAIKEEICRLLSLSEESLKNTLKFFTDKLKEQLDEETKNKVSHNDLQARLFLSRVYLNEFNPKYAAVLPLLSGYEKQFKDRPEVVSQILQLKIESLIKTNDLNTAEILLKDLQNYAGAEKIEITAPSLQLLALAYENIANSIIPSASTPEETTKRKKMITEKKEKSKEEYKKFADDLQRSCEYFYKWVEVRKSTITPDEVLTVADKLYQSAEDIEKNDFNTKASNLYERILNAEYQGKQPRQETWLINWKLAKTYRALKDSQKALSILERLDADKPNNVDIKRELAFAYDECGSLDNISFWESAKKKWAELSRLFKQGTEEWWETKYFYILIDYKAGRFKEALHSINMIESAVSKNYDDDKWKYKTKFIELKKKAETK